MVTSKSKQHEQTEKTQTLYIDPGCPWQNGYVESFHDKFRRECLARELFYTLSEARVVIAAWRKKFNQTSPQPEHEDSGGVLPRLDTRGEVSRSTCILRCSLRPSLRKYVDRALESSINRFRSSRSQWAIKWKGAK